MNFYETICEITANAFKPRQEILDSISQAAAKGLSSVDFTNPRPDIYEAEWLRSQGFIVKEGLRPFVRWTPRQPKSKIQEEQT